MLNLFPRLSKDCESITRRSFLQVGTLAGTGMGLSLPTLLAAKKAQANSPSSDVNCIMIWSRGGTSHHDTVDPKPDAPVSVRGEYKTIDTSIPGVRFTEHVPKLAASLHRYALMRSWNPQNGSHGLADQYVMSGRKFNPALAYPTMGSVVSYHKGFKSAMPPFVQLGNSIDRRFGGGTAGILGLEHNPFELNADPASDKFKVPDIQPPTGVDLKRVERRRGILSQIDDLQRQIDLQPEAYSALDENYQAALNMITATETQAAFDMAAESEETREKYGKHSFGHRCLLARRLIESGVRFVTVTDGGWDNHQNLFKSLAENKLPKADQGISALIEDLDERGMLDNTLVVWLTDFGRTPNVNSASGRDHWASAGFIVMAGAGVPPGHILGETDATGSHPTRDEYKTSSIVSTIYAKLGIPQDLLAHTADGRPIRMIEGTPIKEWM
ncbi:hypothetical protein Pla110_31570 [Polystyrenella longa]|uniref:Sulfatase n=1 Tax=Polystyrenella longa TaxID=2528007 RepID=A0A518CQA3_9PLAN|nr:DUF1501 domain-containing protein [Polystyrenella longa]QDU81416.1 hypothetical protein Pla110_31570 [Polystyrenella longa]